MCFARILAPILMVGFPCCCGLMHGAEVTLTAVADTSLWERDPDDNLGGTDMLPVGTIGSDGAEKRCRLLLKFDLQGAIPPEALVESATLKLHQLRSPDNVDVVNRRFYGYRVLFDWGEGDNIYLDPQKPFQSTMPAGDGEASWTHRFSGAAGVLWQTPGGGIDQDFGDDPQFQFFAQQGTDRDYQADLTLSGLDSISQWRANPNSNFGWVIIVDNENIPFSARQLASRENQNPAYHPKLTIVYSIPGPNEPEIQSIVKNGNSVTVDYSAQANVVYRPQWKNSLGDAGWTDLPEQGPLGSDGTLQFIDDVTGFEERYYQIVIPDSP